MPFIAGFVGYFTNVLALYLTFQPLEFLGIELWRMHEQPWGFFGWQGIIPTKVEKISGICFDLLTTKLLNIKEIFAKLDPVRFSEEMQDGTLLLMDKIVRETALTYMPTAWNALPREVQDDIVLTTHSETPVFLSNFMRDMQEHIDDVLDLKKMTVSACVQNKALINKIFQECGDKEFIFLRRSGFYFGFMFGCIQMAIWFFYDADWILPVAGFLVGWVTNYLALKVIFSPIEPIDICGVYTLHGIFLKRQKEVSESFARIVTVEILHMEALWDSIFHGPLSSNFYAMLRAHTLVFTERFIAELRPVAIAAMGADQVAQMKEDIAQKVLDEMPNIIDNSYTYTTEVLDVENTIREKMAELPSAEFEGVLHPAFEEDELTLIMLGGVLGAIVGVIQLFTLFN